MNATDRLMNRGRRKEGRTTLKREGEERGGSKEESRPDGLTTRHTAVLGSPGRELDCDMRHDAIALVRSTRSLSKERWSEGRKIGRDSNYSLPPFPPPSSPVLTGA